MSQFTTTIEPQPVGFIVYIQENSVNLSMAAFSNASGVDISEILSALNKAGGFAAESDDAIGFFLQESYAASFAEAILSKV